MQETSRAQAIYKAHKNGELTQADMENHMAMLVGETTYDHSPLPYPSASQTIFVYINDRSLDLKEREQEPSFKNGEWLQTINKIKTKNMSDYELLVWAEERCKKLNSTENCKKINDMIVRHSKNHENFDWDFYYKAISVQTKDSRDKQRSLRD